MKAGNVTGKGLHLHAAARDDVAAVILHTVLCSMQLTQILR